jgi:hypothetical protein
MYDFSLGQWAWVNGPRSVNPTDVTVGCPSSNPVECWPGSRLNSQVWQTSPQDVYLSGGLRVVDGGAIDTFGGADLDVWHLSTFPSFLHPIQKFVAELSTSPRSN